MTQNCPPSRATAPRPSRRAAVFLAVLPLALSACASHKEVSAGPPPPAPVLYSQALADLNTGRYEDAVTKFNEVDENYPYSTWATHSELLAGYAQYQDQEYDSAIGSLSRYIALHPTDQDTAYAYYLKAMCYYEQIGDVDRDQTSTFEAIQTLNDVIAHYPDSAYARDARIKLRLATNRLAGHEMVIGRYYEKQHLYAAAIGRFQNVVQTYQATTYTPEALERATECYLDLGLTDAAQRTASVLGYNYPGSPWYQTAYDKLRDHNLVADAQTPPARKSHGFLGLF